MRVAFGGFVLDTGQRLLLYDGAPVALAPKPFALLELLVARRPDAVSKAELIERLWSGAERSETALTTVVNELRKVLGERAQSPRFLRTVRGFGYALAMDGREIAPAPSPAAVLAWLVRGDLRIPIREGETVLGRDSGLGGTIVDVSVSRRHAVIRFDASGSRIEDLESRNGTFVGGKRVKGEAKIADGDEIRLGLVKLWFRLAGHENETVDAL